MYYAVVCPRYRDGVAAVNRSSVLWVNRRSVPAGNACAPSPPFPRSRTIEPAITARLVRPDRPPSASVLLVVVTRTMKTRFAGPVVVMWVVFVMFAFVQPLLAAVTANTADDKVSPTTTVSTGIAEGRGHIKKMMMNPYMMIPQLIALGFAPIVLANLKMMVMSALTMNNMALNAAIFMTIRNMVFGPRPKVKYVNYGYRDRRPHHHHHHHSGGGANHYHNADGQHRQRDEQLLQSSVDGIETYERRKRTAIAS